MGKEAVWRATLALIRMGRLLAPLRYTKASAGELWFLSNHFKHRRKGSPLLRNAVLGNGLTFSVSEWWGKTNTLKIDHC